MCSLKKNWGVRLNRSECSISIRSVLGVCVATVTLHRIRCNATVAFHRVRIGSNLNNWPEHRTFLVSMIFVIQKDILNMFLVQILDGFFLIYVYNPFPLLFAAAEMNEYENKLYFQLVFHPNYISLRLFIMRS